MKPFNGKAMCKECPFNSKKQVTPFSNGTEFMIWHEDNCERCSKYESESEDREKANCKAAYDIDLGTITGKIPLESAKFIGCKYDPLYGTIDISRQCRNFDDKDNPKPF